MQTHLVATRQDQRAEPGRAPLPPGDPLAWGVLVAGTSLDGMAWPGWGNDGWDSPTRQGIRALTLDVSP